MSSKKNDENYEKPSKHKQWQERSESPIASRPMNSVQIEEYRGHLARSYDCPIEDVSYDFYKIKDEHDEDRDDCLWLKYRMKTVSATGKPMVRDIFSIKLPIPDEIRNMADVLRRQQSSRTPAQRKPVRLIESGIENRIDSRNDSRVEDVTGDYQGDSHPVQPTSAPRSRLIKPTRPIKK